MIKSRLLLRRTRHVWSTILRLPHLPLLVLIPVLTLATYFFLSFLGTPHAPKLKNGSGDILYSASNKIFSTTIGTKSGESKISFSVGNAQANFVLAGASPVTAVKENNTTVLFPGLQKDTDLRYTTIPSGLKEELIVKAKPVSNVYLFDLLLKNVRPKQLTTNFIDPTFKDAKGNYLFHFEKPFAVDAKGVRTNNVLLQIGQDKQVPDKYYLKLIVDESWLADSDRAYPITIDPTIVHDTTAEFAAGQLNRVKDLASESSEDIVATGGTITHSGGYTIHTFTSSGTFTPTTSLSTLTLVVGAGGNGSGANWGGGGGGGCSETSETFGASAYTITVGTAPGGSSSIAGTGVSASATGGSNGNLNGGSSGAPTTYSGGIYDTNAGGGGAGCRGAGSNGWGNPPEAGGNGGPGYTSAIDGLCYGGGGGGASGIVGVGSCGGATYSVSNARANSGGGGAGLGNTSGAAGTVIIRYPTTYSNGSTQITTYYQELPRDEYTVGLWHMNESADNSCSGGKDVCDFSGAGNHGIFYGNAAFTSTSFLGPRTTGYDGTGDSTCLGDVELTNGKKLTVEAWFKLSALTEYGSIVSKNSSTWAYALQGDTSTGILRFWVDNNDYTTDAQSNLSVADGKWHHAAGVYDGTLAVANTKLYIDGVLQTQTANQTIDIPNTSDELCFGGYNPSGSGSINGTIDEVRISNIARTPEEIKADASRRPSAVYTSSVLDLTTVAAWSPLTWSEHGVNTGDGETLKDSTSLVAQWNFNETSSTTADNAETTASRDLTLNNFASTGSQDASAGTGWTSNNRRWGAGGIMLSSVATADSLSVSDPASNGLDPNSADLTIETWLNTVDLSSEIFSNNNNNGTSCTNNGYRLGIDATGYPTFYLDTNGATAGCDAQITTSNKPINDGNWHHIAVSVIRGTGAYLYVDGILTGSDTTVTSYSTITVTGTVYLGGSAGGYDGVIDSTRIYSRALGSAEIASNYQAANIEFQTRVGADTSPDDGSWSAWSPTTGETAIDSYDGPYQYNTTDTGLISYWPMDENADNSCTGGSNDVCDKKGSSDGLSTSTTIVDGKYGKARGFNASTQYLDMGDIAAIDAASALSGCAWVYHNSITADHEIFAKGNGATDGLLFFRDDVGSVSGRTDIYSIFVADSADTDNARIESATNTALANTWTFVCFTYEASSATGLHLYINGVEDANSPVSTSTIAAIDGGANPFRIGSNSAGGAYFDGKIDEARIYTSVLSASTIRQYYLEGSTRPETLHPMIDSTYKIEGSASQKIEAGRPVIDDNTVGLWHLDETSGTGAYLKDSSSNANNGTPTGTTTTQGISSKGRSFNGSGDKVVIGDVLDFSGNFSVEAWVKNRASTGTTQAILDKAGTSGGHGYSLNINNSGYANFVVFNTANGDYLTANTTSNILADNKWHHVAGTISGTTISIYLDGVLQASNTSTVGTRVTDSPNSLTIGDRNSSSVVDFNGYIDEVRISNVARSAEEIAETYRAGRDHYINKTISSTDLSGKSSLPFYVAADRPGSYLSATIGESAYANYQPDLNTLGLWHLDEQTGSGAYLKDSSGNANHGTPTGTTYAQGKIGKARNFNGSSDLISIGTGPSVKNLTQYSLESWFYVSTLPTAGNAMTIYKEHRNSDTTVRAKILVENASASYANVANSLTFRFRDTDAATAINVNTGANTISASKWYHVVVVYDSVGDTQKIYLNGQLITTATNTVATVSNTAPFSSNHLGDDAGSEFFNGQIDEVRVSNTARTASEIRQAYEIGLRTHPITIDFGAKLDSGDLITGSGDLGFTVDATYYGLQNKGDALYPGDKIIVKENVDGTEYIAQGTVDSLTVSTGVTTVSAWDSGSTFPSGGFTVNASVFKWQREYWNVNNETLDSHLDAITNLTIRLTSGSEGHTIWIDDLRSNSESSGYLTTPSGSTITSAIGNRYLQYRMIMSSFDEAVSATLSAVTLDYTLNATPTTPSLDSPADTASNQSLTPVLKTTASDAESDYLRYKIELCTNLAMTTDCQTFDQTTSQSGWSGQNAQTSTAYTSGTQATYTVQSALSASTTYYWRTYAIDPGGSNTWSATQSTPRSFSTSTAPTAPTTPYAEGTTNPSNVVDLTPEFSAIHNDGDGDAAVYSEIEVNTNNTFTGTVMWDSGQTAMTSTANGVRSPDISYAGTALGYTGTTYYWRIRFTDNKGAVGAWSVTQNFTLNTPPSVPTLDLPINTATDVIQYAVFKTTAADTDSDYLRYKIQLCTDLAMTTGCQTFDQTSSQTGWSGQNAQTSTAYTSGTQATYTLQTPLSTSTVYYWRSYAIDPAGSNTWSSTQATPFSFTTITAPEAATNCRIQENNTDTATTIVWTDVALTEDKYEVQRAVDGGAFAVLATNLAAGTTSYPDTTISQTHTYRYRVAPYFTTGPTYGAWCTTDTLSLQSGLFKFNGLNFNGIKLN